MGIKHPLILAAGILAVAACAPASGPVAGGPPAEPPSAPASDPPTEPHQAPPPGLWQPPTPAVQTLNGTFTAPRFQDGPRPLKAVFTPTGQQGQWEVVFHFRFNGAQHAYSGTAEGSLDQGDLRGAVRNRQRRTFIFSGTFANGVFQGRHNEVARGWSGEVGNIGAPNTGSLTLK